MAVGLRGRDVCLARLPVRSVCGEHRPSPEQLVAVLVQGVVLDASHDFVLVAAD